MGCAAFGNLASVIVGVLMGERVEKLAMKLGNSSLAPDTFFRLRVDTNFSSYLNHSVWLWFQFAGLPPHGLSLMQLEHASANRVKTLGSVIGVIVGCLIGMLPLYWIDNSQVKDKQPPQPPLLSWWKVFLTQGGRNMKFACTAQAPITRSQGVTKADKIFRK